MQNISIYAQLSEDLTFFCEYFYSISKITDLLAANTLVLLLSLALPSFTPGIYLKALSDSNTLLGSTCLVGIPSIYSFHVQTTGQMDRNTRF